MGQGAPSAWGDAVLGADLNVRDLTDSENARLVDLANVVTRLRTAVERNHHGDVVGAHKPEAPTRFAAQLANAVRSGMAFGLDPETAMARAARYARDSIPPNRWNALNYVLGHPRAEPGEVYLKFDRSLWAVKNDFEILRVLRVARAEGCEERRVGRLAAVQRYTLTSLLNRQILETLRQA